MLHVPGGAGQRGCGQFVFLGFILPALLFHLSPVQGRKGTDSSRLMLFVLGDTFYFHRKYSSPSTPTLFLLSFLHTLCCFFIPVVPNSPKPFLAPLLVIPLHTWAWCCCSCGM